MSETSNNINDIVKIEFLTSENAKFSLTGNGFLQLKATVPNPEKDNTVELIEFERVFLHRAFPYDMPYKYISVFGTFPKPPAPKEESKDKDKAEDKKDNEVKDDKAKDKENVTSVGDLKEIGIISNIAVFDEASQKMLKTTLDNKYFTSIIEIIHSIKDKYGYSYWDVKTNVGRTKFTVHDTYKSLVKINPDRVMVNDINGNRYEIPSLENFDKNSFRKIELFF